MVINYKKLIQTRPLELLGHQASKVLTLVRFPRVQNAATDQKRGFFGSLKVYGFTNPKTSQPRKPRFRADE